MLVCFCKCAAENTRAGDEDLGYYAMRLGRDDEPGAAKGDAVVVRLVD